MADFTPEDFHTIPHEQLQAMVEHADVHRVTVHAIKLQGAANAITRLADDLKKHMDHVHWQGEGGEAFRTWGSDMANATHRLSLYAGNAGTWINYAATTLGSATRMPKVSPEAKAVVGALHAAPSAGEGQGSVPDGDGHRLHRQPGRRPDPVRGLPGPAAAGLRPRGGGRADEGAVGAVSRVGCADLSGREASVSGDAGCGDAEPGRSRQRFRIPSARWCGQCTGPDRLRGSNWAVGGPCDIY
ncbi:hypothetical protein [Streptomyces sp. NPDC002537]